MGTLNVGDTLPDGSIKIVAADSLCYQVLSVSHGACGVRTISKALLAEWVEALKAAPGKTSVQLRTELTGKSQIDKFEYGYNSTLYKLAEMVLGKVAYVHGAKQSATSSATTAGDVLTVALKLFAEKRKASGPSAVRYWVYSPGEQACRWDEMRDGGVVALSYKEVGDFSKLGDKAAIVSAFQNADGDKSPHTNGVRAVVDFRDIMKPGDIVFAKKGTNTFLGAGRVTGGFFHDETVAEYKNRRAAEWFAVKDFVLADASVAQKTLTDVTDDNGLVGVLCKAYGVEAGIASDCWFHEGRSVNGRIREYFDSLTEAKIAAFSENDLKEFFCHSETDPVTHVVFEHMWSGKNGQGWGNIKPSSAAELKTATDYLVKIRHDASAAATFLHKGADRPKGFGPSVVSELLMKFHPESCIKHGSVSRDVLKFLGLVDFESEKSDYDEDEYKLVCGAAALIRGKMKTMKLPRQINADGTEDKAVPDFLTVNEFLWFVSENKDLIKEKVMANTYKKTEIKKVEQKKFSETEVKDFKGFIDKLEKDVEDVGLKYAPDLMKRFVCAQLAKPFVVLTGLSGSGKTKLAEAFTKWIGVENTVNIVPVGADWTNNEKLLGYPNALDSEKYVMPDTGVLKLMLDANENPDLPFFLILDEMNLSHVERYFADFLSTMESNDGIIELYDSGKRYAEDGREIPPSFKFPKNLFVIGTMNVDETTYMFSPKVLDRAQVIEFRVSKDEMSAFLTKPGNPKIDDLAEKGAVYAKAFLDLAKERKTKQPTGDELTKVKDALAAVFPSLAELGAEFGYRSAIEILTFVAYYLEASGYGQIADNAEKEKCLLCAIDAGMLQKLLPKLHGSLNRLGPVLDALIGKVSKSKPQANDPDAPAVIEKLYPLTYEKLQRMKDRVEKNGFTSFAEA